MALAKCLGRCSNARAPGARRLRSTSPAQDRGRAATMPGGRCLRATAATAAGPSTLCNRLGPRAQDR
eukprot:7264129-Lingulodinium_polyedra.AAC.1